jgi:hypothetical protein
MTARVQRSHALMQQFMVGIIRANHEIGILIVGTITICVMNQGPLWQRTTESGFGDGYMFAHLFAVDANLPIPVPFWRSDGSIHASTLQSTSHFAISYSGGST